MSITDVTARISQIQAQLALLPRAGGASATFTDALSRTTAAYAPGDPAGAPGPAGSVTGDQVVTRALELVGLPYVWGGTDPERGVDCSGLVKSVYSTFGIDLPRLSADQARAGTPVASLDQALPGDLIAWDNSGRNVGADHIAIYIGNGMMIEAPRPGGEVQVVPVTTPPDYVRRILADPAPFATTPATAPTAATAPGAAPAGTPYADLFQRAGSTRGVDPALLAAVARHESGFDPRAVSPAGAQGLMQLMPATARGLGVADPFDPAQAVDGAARLIGDLLTRFGSVELALAAYNAGPGAVMRYDGVPPYPETRAYVQSVMTSWQGAA
ncbi:transglycosylase SLT domain-containing protein [Nocardioides sp. zg-1228]|uniref:transglycosylase SLT domain-containing protein n=1 Tax=Nocardioides sp. zg-1228 TaxID=2763008 RepID=UPI0016424B50|nr:transglycosylase SLT domain-containing protein [Nocardioides sp. zg-1228]MBC2932329.1 transglycosylase SLT domain-containing protein [Nocardioides sp. zg-1228]QSF57845.1 transglycosylase SLT domain-containing protein [Nocardioides sp. zg-1228]